MLPFRTMQYMPPPMSFVIRGYRRILYAIFQVSRMHWSVFTDFNQRDQAVMQYRHRNMEKIRLDIEDRSHISSSCPRDVAVSSIFYQKIHLNSLSMHIIYLFVCLFIYLCIYLFIYLFIHLFIYLFICLFISIFRDPPLVQCVSIIIISDHLFISIITS